MEAGDKPDMSFLLPLVSSISAWRKTWRPWRKSGVSLRTS